MRLQIAGYIMGLATGISSTVFMILAFFSMGILGKGMLFLEPNLAIARLELIASIIGVLCLAWNGFKALGQVYNR